MIWGLVRVLGFGFRVLSFGSIGFRVQDSGLRA
jgi:hypothetical protein